MSAPKLHIDIRRAAFSAELIAWALDYAAQGYPVFPCQSNKRPYTKSGFKDATTDPLQILAWWQAWPLAMIGMPTGKVSGLIVLDVDVKNGVNGFETLKANGWPIPANAVQIRTPSGGAHYFFKAPEGVHVPSSAGKIGPGLDLRGDGGYIILPPSRPDLAGDDYSFEPGQECERGRLVW